MRAFGGRLLLFCIREGCKLFAKSAFKGTHKLMVLFLFLTMSIQALNWVMEKADVENPGAKFVLMVLCNYADEDGNCYPSRETLAKKTGFSVRSVQTFLNLLVDCGYIAKTHRRYGDKITSNIYHINIEKHSANSAHSTPTLVQSTTDLSAIYDKKHSANSAPYTKEAKEDTKEYNLVVGSNPTSQDGTQQQQEPLARNGRIPINSECSENINWVREQLGLAVLKKEWEWAHALARCEQEGIDFKEYWRWLDMKRNPNRAKSVTLNMVNSDKWIADFKKRNTDGRVSQMDFTATAALRAQIEEHLRDDI